MKSDCPDCQWPLHPVGISPAGDLLLRCLEHQSTRPPHHFAYFTFDRVQGAPTMYSPLPIPGGRMDPEQRLWLLETALTRLLQDPEETDYLVMQSGTDWCQMVQMMYVEGTVLAEVGSRLWDPCTECQNRPITTEALDALEEMGFTGGGLYLNFAAAGLPPEPRRLARLAERLFITAYAEPADFAVGLRFRHADQAESFLNETAPLLT